MRNQFHDGTLHLAVRLMPLAYFSPVELLDKAAFIQVGNKARIDKLLRFVIVNLRPALRYLLICELETAERLDRVSR